MTSVDPGPIVQRILLGADLRDAREAAGLSTSQASKTLGFYTGKLSKIEQGDAKVLDKDLAKMVKAFDIDEARAVSLKQLANESRRKLPPARVAYWAVKYVNLLAAAHEVKNFSLDTFPGTVQTADYAHAMMSETVNFSMAEVGRMAEEREQRSARYENDETPRLWLIFGEEALYRQVGGPKVLKGQLDKVRRLARLPNITVQALPLEGGAHPAHGTPFTIVNVIDGKPGIVYVENLTGSDYLGQEHTRAYNLAYEKLQVAALSEHATIELLDRRIHEL